MIFKTPIHKFTDTKEINITPGQFLYISNLLSTFRLVIVPLLFILIYQKKYTLAVGIGCIAVLSDILDGFFARLLNQHSELGYILDPIADKCAIGAGIFALILSSPNLEFPIWAFFAIILRDSAIVIGNVILAIKAKMITRSNLWGKCTSFSLSITVIIYLISSLENVFINNIKIYLLYISLVFVVISFISYFRNMIRALNQVKVT
ncbi:CDP-alcohol phosphatidyltransferase family protein [Candidatus Poribacteria bacterium]|nr:CDP-alcohol phosphatidyltransferase family protein [Candidatus Poribacteria bacterium]